MKIINYFIKKKFSLTLSARLIIYFIIFGFIIGYTIFIISTILSTKDLVSKITSIIIKQNFDDILKSDESDVLLKLLNNDKNNYIKRIENINDFTQNFKQIKEIKLIYYDFDDQHWKTIFINKTTNQIFYTTIDNSTIVKLINHRKHIHHDTGDITYNSQAYFGKQDKLKILINLTRMLDRNRYFLVIEIERMGLYNFIKEYRKEVLIFSILLLLFSFFLGKIFTRKIVLPIKKLSFGANEIASGRYDLTFNIKRNDEIGNLAASFNTMSNKIQSNISEITRNLQTMTTMNQIDKAVLSSISRRDLIKRVVGIVSSLFKETKIIIAQYNDIKKGFEILKFDEKESQGLLIDKPFIEDTSGDLFIEIKDQFQYLMYGKKYKIINIIENFINIKIKTFLNIPIFMFDKYLGSLILIKDSNSGYDSHDVESAKMLADQVGIALHSVQIFEEKESLFLGILIALTKSIDAKSKWTAGHSERVAMYSEEIAIKLKLKEEEIRTLTISAILHDFGKIAIPENILDKPGKLTVKEFSIIKQHPQVGAQIIEEIPSYDKILPGVLYHHEHWDGNGYPEGIGEKDIPLNSRIITVADVYDAITDDRPYRKGMEEKIAIDFMNNQKKKIFDPELVDIFLDRLISKKNNLK